MKREIKFRGMRIDNNEWVYGSLCVPSHPSCDAIIMVWESSGGVAKTIDHNVFQNSVGQLIMILDNKQEVYSGDKCNGKLEITDINGNPETHEIQGIVKYLDWAYWLDDYPACDITEVIGNIHEAPHN